MDKKAVFSDSGALKIIIFASVIIGLSVLLMGWVGYGIAENAVINKLKSKDLVFIAQSIASKIDGRIGRAKETAMILAQDPDILEWVEGGEKDEALGRHAKKKIFDIAENYDYDNSFIVSAVTNHYWSEDGKLIDTMSRNDPDDSWFFDVIVSGAPVSIIIDYHKERDDTFVFVDTLVGGIEKPVAVTGVGLNLKDISREFGSYKFGENSNMWLVDEKGDIYLSEDAGHAGMNLSAYLPADMIAKIAANTDYKDFQPGVLEYSNGAGKMYDLVYQPIQSTEWKLVFQIPRSESISIVNSIKVNMAVAGTITILLIVFIFYSISRKIADPYKRAVLLNQELEKKVAERTQELNEKNVKIMDSIEYSKMIQESILPTEEEMSRAFREHFVLWKPRDTVGGDFYWFRKFKEGYVLAVGDCTGHGVPGALMTMAVNSILNHIVDEQCCNDPGKILNELNRLLYLTLYHKGSERLVDNGLDAGIVCASDDGRMTYAGARMSLYKKDSGGLELIKGCSRSVCCRTVLKKHEFMNHPVEVDDDSTFYITTDGFIDQNGGEKNYPMGRNRFEEIIRRIGNESLPSQGGLFDEELHRYMGEEPQRDDIMVIGFRPCI